MDVWPEMSRLPVLLTADFVWGEGETHFAPHFYNVEVYRYNERTDRYEKALTYTTSQKYNGLDSTEKIHVLGAEKKEILRRLKAAK